MPSITTSRSSTRGESSTLLRTGSSTRIPSWIATNSFPSRSESVAENVLRPRFPTFSNTAKSRSSISKRRARISTAFPTRRNGKSFSGIPFWGRLRMRARTTNLGTASRSVPKTAPAASRPPRCFFVRRDFGTMPSTRPHSSISVRSKTSIRTGTATPKRVPTSESFPLMPTARSVPTNT